MNSVNPPVFDHIVGFGAGSWVPFEDGYSINPTDIAAVGVTTDSTPSTRNYANCKGVTVTLANGITNTIHAMSWPQRTANATWFEMPNLNYSAGNVEYTIVCTVFTAGVVIPSRSIIVTGWAPAP